MKLISLYHICSMACWILSFSNNGFPSTILLLYKFVDADNFLDGRLCRRRQSLNFVANGCNSNQPVGFGWLLPDRSEHCAVQQYSMLRLRLSRTIGTAPNKRAGDVPTHQCWFSSRTLRQPPCLRLCIILAMSTLRCFVLNEMNKITKFVTA